MADFTSQWEDAAVKEAYRHMRIHFRQHSPAVRNMVLQECMTDMDPKQGVEALLKCVESKLTLP